MTNGELLHRATPKFDLFITCDQNIRYQQNLTKQKIAVMQLSTNDLRRIRAAISAIQSAVGSIQRSEFRVRKFPDFAPEMRFASYPLLVIRHGESVRWRIGYQLLEYLPAGPCCVELIRESPCR
jgi:hypothetical protein